MPVRSEGRLSEMKAVCIQVFVISVCGGWKDRAWGNRGEYGVSMWLDVTV